MAFKIVQNYQLSESSSYIQDGIDIYIAQHNVTKLPYLLKKVNTKEISDKTKYQSLINEIAILKILSHPSIVQCHKMLKTSNNIYLVYDYCDGSPLTQLISQSSKQTSKKYANLELDIAKQIVQVLQIMKNASVVHSNLKPTSIIVSSDNKIKVMNFTYGYNRDHKITGLAKFKPPPSSYVAPEVIKNGMIHEKSDFYSFGVILDEMKIEDKGEIAKIIQKMLSQDPNQRPDLDTIEEVIKGKGSNGSSIPKSKQNSSSRSPSKKPLSPVKLNVQNKQLQKKFVQQILKRRNLAIFLLSISQTCLSVDQEQRQNKISIFLSFMLMKKSSKIICDLFAFLKGEKIGQHDSDLNILDKAQRQSFQKKPDCFKLISTIQKQSANQKRWLQDIHKNISSQLPPKMKELIDLDDVDNTVLLNYVRQFLIQTLETGEQQISNKNAENLYLMSEIIPHKSYEKMFEEIISEEKISLDEQYLYIHVKKMDKKKLLAQISSRLRSEEAKN